MAVERGSSRQQGPARSPLPSPAAGLARPLSRDRPIRVYLFACSAEGGAFLPWVRGEGSRRKPCRCTDRAAAPEDRQPGLCWQVGQWRRALRSGRTWSARVFALSTGGPSPPDLLPTGEDGATIVAALDGPLGAGLLPCQRQMRSPALEPALDESLHRAPGGLAGGGGGPDPVCLRLVGARAPTHSIRPCFAA